VPRKSVLYYTSLAAILVLAGIGLFLGWRLFWFLTDDAFIAFRYISNAHFGYGYVWNPPPFKPVEGYTSFLWVVLLDVVWRGTGIEPPVAANPIALVFAAGTLVLVVGMVLRLKLSPVLERWRLVFLALVLLGTLTNRTFLAWTSSGLETAMFNFWFTAWVLVAFSLKPGSGRWLALLTTTAVLMELSRPDGLLFLAATLFLAAVSIWQRLRARRFRPALLLALSPVLLTAAHQAWRVATYHAWLPNTYVAKYAGPWPESGIRYLLSFVIEYSLWFWLALAVVFLLVLLRRVGALPRLIREWTAEPLQPSLVHTIAAGAVLAHFLYYTFIIGGDHFEYRVYSQLVPLLLVTFVWLLNALAMRPAVALGLLSLSLAAGLPIPWTHWALTQRFHSRAETFNLQQAVAPSFPAPVRPYLAWFDSMQAWLIQRAVAVRHQEHKSFYEVQASIMPPREAGLLLSPRVEAVRVEGAVGVLSWVLPTAAIVDAHGLNDLIIARSPIDPTIGRVMAHDRVPPEGYLECFGGNVSNPISKFIVGQRYAPLATLVPDCENAAYAASAWRADRPSANIGMPPTAERVIDNIWTPEPLFIFLVMPDQAPVQPTALLAATFQQAFHDDGCLVTPTSGEADSYQYAFLAPNLRYSPEELRAMFPWAGMVDFERTGHPEPYRLAYAVPAKGAVPLTPGVAHAIAWPDADLIGYTLSADRLEPGSVLEVILFFRAKQATANEEWFRLTLEDPAQPDSPLALDQADPCRGTYPSQHWEPGQVIMAKAFLAVPDSLAPGHYSLRAGMFDLSLGPDTALPATGDPIIATLASPGMP
jgi:arabinofuranosyltransferase